MGETLQTSRATIAGSIRPPSDKSLTHRALIFGSLAKAHEQTRILTPLLGEDCLATLRILGQVGALRLVSESPQELVIEATAPWFNPDTPADCGNSGTTMRLLTGVFASREGIEVTLTGDASLTKRPMRRAIDPLIKMGADIEGDTAPLRIVGKPLIGITYDCPIASAQLKSCLLLAGVRAEGETIVTEPTQSRDHTERMLQSLGAKIKTNGLTTTVSRSDPWPGFDFAVPADISSAAFWMVAAAIAGRAPVTLREVGFNPTRTGILNVFRQAGIRVDIDELPERMGEPVANLTIHPTASPQAFKIDESLVPRLIDEVPVLAVLASQCVGTTTIRDIGDLRNKESDRIAATAAGLTQMGAQVEVGDDWITIHGPNRLFGAELDANHDHRIAMAFAVAGLVADGSTEIRGAGTIRTSYPNFEEHLDELRNS